MDDSMSATSSVCLIGFGEVGQTLATDLLGRGVRDVCAWDVRFSDPDSPPSRAARLSAIRAATGLEPAVVGARTVISAVTASECLAAATSAAPFLERGAVYLDLNSVSPGTKIEAARRVDAAGGRYVEAAVMSPISPKRSGSPILLGGPHAAAFLPVARELGFLGTEVFAAELGRASAAKMCRSVMIKGIEALLTESLVAARHYGVESIVLESLQGLLPVGDWAVLSRYMISRSLLHGARRAEEMREVARTVEAAGVSPWMSEACVERQAWAADFAGIGQLGSLDALLDALLAARSRDSGVLTC
jgi:3-hydroxyisobutyrate dehydrogenase-like beta-hydroxyacid dehydrogenase